MKAVIVFRTGRKDPKDVREWLVPTKQCVFHLHQFNSSWQLIAHAKSPYGATLRSIVSTTDTYVGAQSVLEALL